MYLTIYPVIGFIRSALENRLLLFFLRKPVHWIQAGHRIFQAVDQLLTKRIGILDLQIGAIDLKDMVRRVVQAPVDRSNTVIEHILVVENPPSAQQVIGIGNVILRGWILLSGVGKFELADGGV